eukprot:COSAG02_NODE_7807_length_2838_cov_3.921869_2_plen_44_part_00
MQNYNLITRVQYNSRERLAQCVRAGAGAGRRTRRRIREYYAYA